MSRPEQGLRAASDALLADLDELGRLEQAKRRMELGDPRVAELSRQIEELAARVLAASIEQRALTDEVEMLARVAPPSMPTPPIEEVPPRELHEILAEWRDAERRALSSPPGSAEADQAASDAARLRAEYRHAHEAVRDRTDPAG